MRRGFILRLIIITTIISIFGYINTDKFKNQGNYVAIVKREPVTITIPNKTKLTFLENDRTEFYIEMGVEGEISKVSDFLDDVATVMHKVKREYQTEFTRHRDTMLDKSELDIEKTFIKLALKHKDLQVTYGSVMVSYLDTGDGEMSGYGKAINKIIRNGKVEFLGY